MAPIGLSSAANASDPALGDPLGSARPPAHSHMGRPADGLNETRYVDEIEGGRCYLWTGVTVEKPVSVSIMVSRR